jgi:ABC-type sugar transport system permease subunit
VATALVSFNVGVEIGQLAVIALAFLVVGRFRRRPWYRPRIVIPMSLAIAAVGLYWSLERTGLV